MSEDTSEGFADQPRARVLCTGCGLNVESEDATPLDRYSIQGKELTHACRKCTACPDMRESYQRGYNAGLDAMGEHVNRTVKSIGRCTSFHMMNHQWCPARGWRKLRWAPAVLPAKGAAHG